MVLFAYQFFRYLSGRRRGWPNVNPDQDQHRRNRLLAALRPRDFALLEPHLQIVLSLSETYALKYWWCSPPRTGIASVRPTVWMARGIGASLCSDRCVRASL